MAMSNEEMVATYPLTSYRFRVNVKGKTEQELCCTEVSGLKIEYQYAEYRDGCGNWFLIPGLLQQVNITLKRGLFRDRNEFYEWICTTTNSAADARDLTISMTDESGEKPILSWSVANAMPKSLDMPPMNGNSNEIAVESVQLVATRVKMEFA